jgi:hypothetical protein
MGCAARSQQRRRAGNTPTDLPTLTSTAAAPQQPPAAAPRVTPRRPPSSSTLTARAAAGAARQNSGASLRAPSDAGGSGLGDAASESGGLGSMQGSADDLSSLAGDEELWAERADGSDNVRVRCDTGEAVTAKRPRLASGEDKRPDAGQRVAAGWRRPRGLCCPAHALMRPTPLAGRHPHAAAQHHRAR